MTKRVILSLILLCMLLASSTFAATKEDVIAAINQTYTIAGKPYRLPQSYITKGEDYLNSHELTEDQYSRLLNAIYKAVGIAQKNETTDIKKIDKKDIQEALSVVVEVTQAAEIDLNKELSQITTPKKSNPPKKETPIMIEQESVETLISR